MTLTTHKSVLGLDVGGKRIGIAVVSLDARLPRPLVTLEWNDGFFTSLDKVIKDEEAGALVVGLPRNLEGEPTAQTESTNDFIGKLREHVGLPIHTQDEAMTSKKAEAELEARGKPYEKGDIDALAATYILQDWLVENPKGNI